jgi:hypothetical protein
MVNLLYRVWNKSGTALIPPVPTDELWSGFGGDCEMNNDGDPVVFYDEINDRWVLSQFVFSVSQCIACSKTGDPTGEYWLYEYSTPGNDYPKMSNMPGAYYGTIRNFSGSFKMDAHAWNGAKIRAGDPTAEMIVRTMTGVSGIDGVQPADLDGPPPASSPGIFVGHQDSNNRLYIYQMVPNFSSPGSTTFTGPTFISVPSYSSSFSVNVPQPGTSQRLDIIAPFTRFVTHFRDFGTHQTLIVNHSVDINDFSDHAGERWYELRNTGGGWTLFQSGSYAPDAHHRWMGNAAMNGLGDIGLGYSVSSSSLNPSVRYTGRKASDPAGQMTMAEGVIAAGTGSQTGGGRWGDYSRITVDPADDETFWYFGEYVQATGNYEWNTKIGAFKVTAGGPPPSYTTRINSGGSAYTTGGGVSFVADQAFTTGGFGYINGSSQSYTNPIAGTTDDLLYQNVRRRNGSNFQYDFTVPTGTYSVTLHMMSPATNWVMDVSAEGVLIYDNFDIDTQAGGTYTAVTRTFSTSVTDGRLDLTFTRVSGYAAVAAIEVVQTAAPSLTQNEASSELAVNVPETFQLEQNYPNPFNPSTRIRYQIPNDMRVTLRIYNLMGEEVRTLVERQQSAGNYEVTWDGLLNSGVQASSGVYIYRLQGEGFSETRKMTLMQ